MFRCHICIFLANSVVYYWALTPSHQNPPPIGNQRSRWAVPDLCQCPIMVEDRAQTHSNQKTHTHTHTYTHTHTHTHTPTGKWREGEEEKKTKDSHIHSKIKRTDKCSRPANHEEQPLNAFMVTQWGLSWDVKPIQTTKLCFHSLLWFSLKGMLQYFTSQFTFLYSPSNWKPTNCFRTSKCEIETSLRLFFLTFFFLGPTLDSQYYSNNWFRAAKMFMPTVVNDRKCQVPPTPKEQMQS